MSTFTRELLLVRRGFDDRVELVRRMVARATAGPLLVRAAVFGCAVVSLVLAFPVEMVVNAPAGALLVVALLPALRPRGALVTVVIFIAVLGWMINTSLYVEPITVWRLAALAGALYLLHTTAALASVLPYDTVVVPGVLVGWLLRAGVVVVLTAGFAVAVMLGVLPIGSGRSFLIASIAGLAVMASIASLLAYLRRR
jgi:hypothetical protein